MQKWIESLELVSVGRVDRSQTRSEMESLRLSVSQISKSEHSVFRKQMSSEKGTRNKLYIKNEDVLLGNKKTKMATKPTSAGPRSAESAEDKKRNLSAQTKGKRLNISSDQWISLGEN